MNPRTALPSHPARQLPEAKQRPPCHSELKNLYGRGAMQAADLAKTTFATAVTMNSCAMDLCKHLFWYPLGLEYWFEAQNRAFALGMDLAAQWFGLQAPHGETTPALRVIYASDLTPEERAEVEKEIEEEIEEIEEGMDVAVQAFEEEILA